MTHSTSLTTGRPKLTIGMATYDDYDGAWFTLQSLRLHHDLSQVELLVVDNRPDSPGSKTLKGQIENTMQAGCAGARYIAAPEITGTSAPRDRVFAEAAGEAVLCIDSHVLLPPGAIARLLKWYADHPDSLDLLQGPLLYDNLNSLATHFNDVWRGEMWGVWGQAWQRTNEEMTNERMTSDGVKAYSVLDVDGRAQLIDLLSGAPADLVIGHSSLDISSPVPYAGHEKFLLANGLRPLGFDPDDEFEIPGQGLGLFTCRKEAWLGFNPNFRGFGGEEMYIHEKFRQAGRKCLCLGFLKWLHRFARPNGVKYPLSRWNKVRNYVLGHLELGLPLDPIHEHFVASPPAGGMPQAEWDALVENPNDEGRMTREGRRPNDGMSKPFDIGHSSLDISAIYAVVKAQSPYMNLHLDTLRELAAQCEVVEEVSRYQETTVALFAGLALPSSRAQAEGSERSESKGPKILRSHLFGGGCHNPLFEQLAQIAAENGVQEFSRETSPDCAWADWNIQECDMLVYKTADQHKGLADDLAAWMPKVRRWFVLPDTHYNQALAPALRDFVKANPEWFVYFHDSNQFGLTVLGRLDSDRPAVKIHAWHPEEGPGTELKKILADIGVNPAPSCDCNGKARQMDLWGVAGCREQFDTIVGWMRDGQDRWGWKEKLAIAAKAVVSGLVFKLNWTDPYPGLIEEAIRRAEMSPSSRATFGPSSGRGQAEGNDQ
jgi:hypothetical protein